VAVAAGLVALATDVELKRDERGSPQRQFVLSQLLLELIHRRQFKGWTLKGNALIIRA